LCGTYHIGPTPISHPPPLDQFHLVSLPLTTKRKKTRNRVRVHALRDSTGGLTLQTSQSTMKRRRLGLPLSLLSLLLTSTPPADAQTTIQPRYGQATVYANNTAYFLGGILSDTSLSTDFFSLNLSTQFNVSSPPWQSLPSLPSSTGNAAAAIDPDGRVYLLGGQTWDCTSSFANVYDPQSSSWGTPQFFGTAPVRREAARTFLNNDNEVILFWRDVNFVCDGDGVSV
jgi:hypothetical protein